MQITSASSVGLLADQQTRPDQAPLDIIIIFFPASPACENNDSTAVIEMSLHEETEILCSMKWESDLNFRWTMKSNSIGEKVDFPKSLFTKEGHESKLRFSPRSSSDYGEILCMAFNSYGDSGQPCRYLIKDRGRAFKNNVFFRPHLITSLLICRELADVNSRMQHL